MKLPVFVEAALAPLGAKRGTDLSRFHIASLAFQRTRQLKQGARPRVESADHKVCTVALLEVLADTVSWHLTDAIPPRVV